MFHIDMHVAYALMRFKNCFKFLIKPIEICCWFQLVPNPKTYIYIRNFPNRLENLFSDYSIQSSETEPWYFEEPSTRKTNIKLEYYLIFTVQNLSSKYSCVHNNYSI